MISNYFKIIPVSGKYTINDQGKPIWTGYTKIDSLYSNGFIWWLASHSLSPQHSWAILSDGGLVGAALIGNSGLTQRPALEKKSDILTRV